MRRLNHNEENTPYCLKLWKLLVKSGLDLLVYWIEEALNGILYSVQRGYDNSWCYTEWFEVGHMLFKTSIKAIQQQALHRIKYEIFFMFYERATLTFISSKEDETLYFFIKKENEISVLCLFGMPVVMSFWHYRVMCECFSS